MDGVRVYDARIRAGRMLAKSYPVEADLVTGVPESGLPAAQGYAQESGIPFGLAFYKNGYIGRTFIKPTQTERESAVRMKLSVLESAVKDKRIVLVDDSIVRGTTIANLIRMLKEAGAREVHVRISSPPFLYPCYFGTDVPSNSQLIAANHSEEAIREMIGADSLGYMRLEDLEKMAEGLPLCKACFDGVYPMDCGGV
jgi:amidophosphoribosyltransferase